MIKLVAFDWNGTLFSDTYASLRGVNILLKRLNLSEVTLKQYQSSFDFPLDRFYTALGVSKDQLEQNWEIHVEVFNSYYQSIERRVRTRSNARMVLKWLKENNIKAIILSNHRTESIMKELKRLKLLEYINSVEANEVFASTLRKRNKREKFKKFLDGNKYLPEECILVGDTVEEIDIGEEFGAITVAISQGYSSISRLKQAKPDYIIHNLKNLIPIIKEINKQYTKI